MTERALQMSANGVVNSAERDVAERVPQVESRRPLAQLHAAPGQLDAGKPFGNIAIEIEIG